jgi:hypothetical protein
VRENLHPEAKTSYNNSCHTKNIWSETFLRTFGKRKVPNSNLADGEYILTPEQGFDQEKIEEPAPKPTTEVLSATPAPEDKPRFYA